MSTPQDLARLAAQQKKIKDDLQTTIQQQKILTGDKLTGEKGEQDKALEHANAVAEAKKNAAKAEAEMKAEPLLKEARRKNKELATRGMESYDTWVNSMVKIMAVYVAYGEAYSIKYGHESYTFGRLVQNVVDGVTGLPESVPAALRSGKHLFQKTLAGMKH